MLKRRAILRCWRIFVFVAAILFCGIAARGMNKDTSKQSNGSAGLIIVDTMASFGKLDRPPVVFLHDLHTDILEKRNKGCLACHQSVKNRLSFKFRHIKEKNRQDLMNIYHTGCIECHKETALSGDKSGPVACGECHMEKPGTVSLRQAMGMDNSLHYRHSKSLQNKCELCHHEYNKKTQKLFYAKEKEGTCRYCHKKKTEENRISMKLASHASCIDCHMKRTEKKQTAGPVKCRGCHDKKSQKSIKKIANIPRIERKQPDTVMIKTGKKDYETVMNYVPFDHKAHEKYNDTCRGCHHKALSPCNKCHTLEGSKDGSYISLEQAMHQAGVRQSCTGCHKLKQREKNCSGCHALIAQNRKQDDALCLNCHIKPAPEMAKTSDDAAIAMRLLVSRKTVAGTYDEVDIPEKVKIEKLSDKYKPVEFPHRKIVNAIVKNISDSKLANYFHNDKGTVCQGCHHNSPASLKPPRCMNCHSRLYNEKDMNKPGLMGAYHIQCMECHVNMGGEKAVGCTDCHEEKMR